MSPLLPAWVRWLWVGIFVLILAQHSLHAARMRGVHRAWHVGHTLMAIGMAYMFLPADFRLLPFFPWQFFFVIAALLSIGFAVLELFRGKRVDLPWITLSTGLVVMVYMWAMMEGTAWAALSYTAAVWFAIEAAGWLTGELCGNGAIKWLPPGIGLQGVKKGPFLAGQYRIAHRTTRSGRLTLALMAAGMAYMLVAMQNGA